MKMRGADGQWIGRAERIKLLPRHKGPKIPYEEKVRILEAMVAMDNDQDRVCRELFVTKRAIAVSMKWHKMRGPDNPYRQKAIAEKTLRERVYELAVKAVERGLAEPIPLMKEFLATEGIVCTEDLIGVYLSFISKQTSNAAKVLEGVKDGLVKQGEVKHTGDQTLNQTQINILIAGRERIAKLIGSGSE